MACRRRIRRSSCVLKGETIVCFGSIDWAFNWQIPQEVASGLAEAGNRVLYVENTGVRNPVWRDASRIRTRMASWWRDRGAPRSVRGGLDVYSPVLAPFPYSPLATRINAAAMLRAIRRWLAG